MNPPGAPADDKRLRALAGEVRQDDWPRLDNAWERFRGQYGIHARRDTGMDAHAFLVEAFLQADHRGLVQALATELIKEDLVTDKFAARLLKVVGASAYELQAFQGGVFRPVNALIAAKDLLAACEHVCRIDVEDRQSGTGVQVSQTLVATAAHVVWELVARRQDGTLDLRADGSLRAAPGSLGKLTLTFGDVMDYLEDDESDPQRRPGEVAPLHPDWLAWGSQPTDNERAEACSTSTTSPASTPPPAPGIWRSSGWPHPGGRRGRPGCSAGIRRPKAFRSTSCTIRTAVPTGASRCSGRSGSWMPSSAPRRCAACTMPARCAARPAPRFTTRGGGWWRCTREATGSCRVPPMRAACPRKAGTARCRSGAGAIGSRRSSDPCSATYPT